MTTGERLVDLSTLTTGTAMEHYLTIGASGGVCYGEVDVELESPELLAVVEGRIIDIELAVRDYTEVEIVGDFDVQLENPDIEVELE